MTTLDFLNLMEKQSIEILTENIYKNKQRTSIRNELDVPYNFYIEGIEDLNELLKARGFSRDDFSEIMGSGGVEDYFCWEKSSARKKYDLRISQNIFEEGKLKFIKKTDWNSSFFNLLITEIPDDNDLPF